MTAEDSNLMVTGKEANFATLDAAPSVSVAEKRRNLQSAPQSGRNKKKAKDVYRSRSVQAFDGIGCEYNVPVRDHKYEINYGLKFGEFGVKRRPSGYMVAIEKRARSVINPQKYTHQADWKKRSK